MATDAEAIQQNCRPQITVKHPSMANSRFPHDAPAGIDEQIRLDAELEEVTAEMFAHERAGTLVGEKKRELHARFDDVIKRDKETVRQMPSTGLDKLRGNLFDSTGPTRALILSTAWLSPTLFAIALLLVGAIGPDPDARGLIGMYLFTQTLFLYCGFKLFSDSDRPPVRPPGLRHKLKLESMFRDNAQHQRRIFIKYSAIVLTLLFVTTALMY